MKLPKRNKGWRQEPIRHGLAAKGIKTKKVIVDIGAGYTPYEKATIAIDPNLKDDEETRKYIIGEHQFHKTSTGKSIKLGRDKDYEKAIKQMKFIPAQVYYKPKTTPIITDADEVRMSHASYIWGISRVLPQMKKMVKPGGKIYIKDYASQKWVYPEDHPPTAKIIRNQAKRLGLKVSKIRTYQDKEFNLPKVEATLIKPKK